jgi:hypothetical protein
MHLLSISAAVAGISTYWTNGSRSFDLPTLACWSLLVLRQIEEPCTKGTGVIPGVQWVCLVRTGALSALVKYGPPENIALRQHCVSLAPHGSTCLAPC